MTLSPKPHLLFNDVKVGCIIEKGYSGIHQNHRYYKVLIKDKDYITLSDLDGTVVYCLSKKEYDSIYYHL